MKAYQQYRDATKDSVKKKMLSLFPTDKKCSFVNTFNVEEVESTKQREKSSYGWCSRFEVAAAVHMKANDDPAQDSEALKAVLRNCHQDDDWDASLPEEAAMKEIKERRYFFTKKHLKSEEHDWQWREIEGHRANKETTCNVDKIMDSSSSSSSRANVPVTDPTGQQVKFEASILTSAIILILPMKDYLRSQLALIHRSKNEDKAALR